jgi:two-component system response regulator (stage 0 sporulation protein F)
MIRRLRVFLAEDDPQMRRLIAESLRRDGHFVVEAPDGPALLSDLGHVFWGNHPDGEGSLIISDARMPGRGGLAILHGIRRFPWCPPFILITAFGDQALHDEATRLGVHRIFDKPFDLDDLRQVVNQLARNDGPPAIALAPAVQGPTNDS